LKAVNVRVRNAKSQLVRARTLDEAREAALKDQIAAGEAKAEELRKTVPRGDAMAEGFRTVFGVRLSACCRTCDQPGKNPSRWLKPGATESSSRRSALSPWEWSDSGYPRSCTHFLCPLPAYNGCEPTLAHSPRRRRSL
jgi:hypothetical protein